VSGHGGQKRRRDIHGYEIQSEKYGDVLPDHGSVTEILLLSEDRIETLSVFAAQKYELFVIVGKAARQSLSRKCNADRENSGKCEANGDKGRRKRLAKIGPNLLISCHKRKLWQDLVKLVSRLRTRRPGVRIPPGAPL